MPGIGSILFGGLAVTAKAPHVDGDTWRWTGASWEQVTPKVAPPASFGAAFALDPTTGKLVLFGGGTASKALSDTWVGVG